MKNYRKFISSLRSSLSRKPSIADDVKDILQKEGIREFAQDIRIMSRKQLIEHFSYKKNNKVNVTLLIKNLIWQAYTWIQQGKIQPIDGNIRSFWYRHVKSVLSRLELKTSGNRFTDDVYGCFVKLRLLGLFRYVDFGFLDERGHARVIGNKHGNLILFAEKDGLYGIIKKLALQYDITGISLNGFPSYLTTEFLLRDMQRFGLLDKPLRLFSVVDYDPSGYWIEREFAAQFRDLGTEVSSVTTLVNPRELPQELVELCKYKLKKDTQTQNWLIATGGIGSEAFGLEADAVGAGRIGEAVERIVHTK